jgi:integrase
MKLSRAVQEFLADCRLKLTPASMAAYESDLTRLVALASPDSVLAFTPELVRAYFLGLSHQGRRLSTLYRKHSVLHEFGRWGVRKKLWLASPMDEIPRPPKPEHLPRPFTPDEIGRIMRLELPPVESVIRGLLYYTGLRVSPICQLRIGDVSFDELAYPNGVTFPGVIRTIGKGNKPLVTPMHPGPEGAALRPRAPDYGSQGSLLAAAPGAAAPKHERGATVHAAAHRADDSSVG